MKKVREFIEGIIGKKQETSREDLYPSYDFIDRIDRINEIANSENLTRKMVREATVLQRYEDYIGLLSELRKYEGKEDLGIDFSSASPLAQKVLAGNPMAPVFFVGEDRNKNLIATQIFKYNCKDSSIGICSLVDGEQVDKTAPYQYGLLPEDSNIDTLAFASLNEVNRMKVTAEDILDSASIEA